MNAEQQYEKLAAKLAEANRKSKEEMDKKADYKIQIWFRSDRSIRKPITFTLSFWESGKRLHGGGDEMMFLCRRHTEAPRLAPFEVAFSKKDILRDRGCDGFISGGLVNVGMVVCPHCHTKHRTSEIGDSIYYTQTIEQASSTLASWWRKLDGNADIYAKYRPDDPRTVQMARGYCPRTAREKKGLTIYPLANILKDTMTGASVESRFKAFITA
jgi:hypothetical protein